MISDAQFEKMGLAIGQVAMMKALLAAEYKEGEEAKGVASYMKCLCVYQLALFHMTIRLF